MLHKDGNINQTWVCVVVLFVAVLFAVVVLALVVVVVVCVRDYVCAPSTVAQDVHSKPSTSSASVRNKTQGIRITETMCTAVLQFTFKGNNVNRLLF